MIKTLTLMKKSQLSNYKGNIRFMTGAFLITLTQLEKTGSTG